MIGHLRWYLRDGIYRYFEAKNDIEAWGNGVEFSAAASAWPSPKGNVIELRVWCSFTSVFCAPRNPTPTLPLKRGGSKIVLEIRVISSF